MPEALLYNTGVLIPFPLIGTGTQGTFTTALALPDGDIKIAQSTGGTFFTAVNTTNTGTIIAGANFYQLSLTTSELSCERFILVIKDQDASETYRDQALMFVTYGDASAFIKRDISIAQGSANVTQILGTAVVGTSGTLTNVGTVAVLLTGTVSTVTGNVTATTALGTISANIVAASGTAVVGTQGRINVGSVDVVLTGTVTTVTNVVSANIVQVKGTAVPGTQGTLVVDAGGLTGTIDANIIQVKGTGVPGTQGTLVVNAGGLTGTIDANVIQILGTAAVGTSGTLTNVGTVSLLLTGTVTTVTNNVTAATALGTVSANVVAASGTAVVGTQGRINVGSVDAVLTGTISTVTGIVSANLIQVLATAVNATSGTLTNVGTVGVVLTGTVSTITGVVSADLIQILATAVGATSGTLTNIGTANTALGTVNADVKLIDGTAQAASNWRNAALGAGSGTAAGTLSTTTMSSDLFTATADDYYKDASVVFNDGTLDQQRTEISAYNGSSKQATIVAITVAPAAGQPFALV